MGKTVNVGIAFGCFIPLHRGHIESMLERALRENDIVIVGVAGYDMDRGKDFTPFLRRLRFMKEIYEHEPRVIVTEVDDKKIGLTGTFSTEAWKTWAEELFNNAGFNKLGWSPDTESIHFRWYVGEQSYAEKIAAVYPQHEVCLIDRTKIDISGTMVRKDPLKYKDDIHPLFWKYLVQNGIVKNMQTPGNSPKYS